MFYIYIIRKERLSTKRIPLIKENIKVKQELMYSLNIYLNI